MLAPAQTDRFITVFPPSGSTAYSSHIVVGVAQIIQDCLTPFSAIMESDNLMIPQAITPPEAIVENENAAWLQQAQQYLDNLTEEQLAWLKLSEQSLLHAWGEEDDIWDQI